MTACRLAICMIGSPSKIPSGSSLGTRPMSASSLRHSTAFGQSAPSEPPVSGSARMRCPVCVRPRESPGRHRCAASAAYRCAGAAHVQRSNALLGRAAPGKRRQRRRRCLRRITSSSSSWSMARSTGPIAISKSLTASSTSSGRGRPQWPWEENHDLPDDFLIGPVGGGFGRALLADPSDVQEARRRLLDHLEDFQPERSDKAAGIGCWTSLSLRR